MPSRKLVVKFVPWVVLITVGIAGLWLPGTGAGPAVHADGMLAPPRDYTGSLEERAQEAILIFHPGAAPGQAREDVILKIQIEASAAAESFGWIVPFPSEPDIAAEDPKLFEELFQYVEARKAERRRKTKGAVKYPNAKALSAESVEVLARKVVGNYDVAIVKETEAGGLNPWLKKEGFRALGPEADGVLKFYREKGYVFACMKFTDAALTQGGELSVHPLRFSFATGGSDGIFFPMKLSGLQTKPFDVNLYVFYGKWLNDRLSKYGYEYRGFKMHYRDWDSEACVPNAGKAYSAPATDPFLKAHAEKLKNVASLFQKLHPGETYYLTNLQLRGLKPADVKDWVDDLWLFPYYTDSDFVPHDARDGGVAQAAWPDPPPSATVDPYVNDSTPGPGGQEWLFVLAFGCLSVVIWGIVVIQRRRRQEEA